MPAPYRNEGDKVLRTYFSLMDTSSNGVDLLKQAVTDDNFMREMKHLEILRHRLRNADIFNAEEVKSALKEVKLLERELMDRYLSGMTIALSPENTRIDLLNYLRTLGGKHSQHNNIFNLQSPVVKHLMMRGMVGDGALPSFGNLPDEEHLMRYYLLGGGEVAEQLHLSIRIRDNFMKRNNELFSKESRFIEYNKEQVNLHIINYLQTVGKNPYNFENYVSGYIKLLSEPIFSLSGYLIEKDETGILDGREEDFNEVYLNNISRKKVLKSPSSFLGAYVRDISDRIYNTRGSQPVDSRLIEMVQDIMEQHSGKRPKAKKEFPGGVNRSPQDVRRVKKFLTLVKLMTKAGNIPNMKGDKVVGQVKVTKITADESGFEVGVDYSYGNSNEVYKVLFKERTVLVHVNDRTMALMEGSLNASNFTIGKVQEAMSRGYNLHKEHIPAPLVKDILMMYGVGYDLRSRIVIPYNPKLTKQIEERNR